MTEFALSGMGDLATWVSVVLTVIAGVTAVIGFVTLRRRERRQALTDLHASLTSGEAAAARNTIGTLLYASSEDDCPARLDAIAAYFALIWAVQRARNVFRIYSLEWRDLEAPSTRLERIKSSRSGDAKDALTWNLSEIAVNIVQFHDRYGANWSVEDKDAWDDIGSYVNAERLRRGLAMKSQ